MTTHFPNGQRDTFHDIHAPRWYAATLLVNANGQRITQAYHANSMSKAVEMAQATQKEIGAIAVMTCDVDETVPCLWCGEPLPDSRADAPYCCGECRTNNND
jgi:hypothetical protein